MFHFHFWQRLIRRFPSRTFYGTTAYHFTITHVLIARVQDSQQFYHKYRPVSTTLLDVVWELQSKQIFSGSWCPLLVVAWGLEVSCRFLLWPFDLWKDVVCSLHLWLLLSSSSILSIFGVGVLALVRILICLLACIFQALKQCKHDYFKCLKSKKCPRPQCLFGHKNKYHFETACRRCFTKRHP